MRSVISVKLVVVHSTIFAELVQRQFVLISPHSTTPTLTSSQGCWRVGRLPRSACHWNNFRKSRASDILERSRRSLRECRCRGMPNWTVWDREQSFLARCIVGRNKPSKADQHAAHAEDEFASQRTDSAPWHTCSRQQSASWIPCLSASPVLASADVSSPTQTPCCSVLRRLLTNKQCSQWLFDFNAPFISLLTYLQWVIDAVVVV